ncbi:hypothetical protein EE612_048956, partial [Oryza sativa]
RRISLDKQGPTVVHQKNQVICRAIFGLPPDEVVEHSYSCALERSFLYHGACMSLHGTFASIQTSSLSRSRLCFR